MRVPHKKCGMAALFIAALIATTIPANADIVVGAAGNAELGATNGDTSIDYLAIGNQAVVTDTGATYDLAASMFNLSDQTTPGGQVTPFIAQYTGGAGGEKTFANYNVLAIGDLYVGADTGAGVSVAFQAAAGTLTTSNGDVIVSGFFGSGGASGVVGYDGDGPAGSVRIAAQGSSVALGAGGITFTGTDFSAHPAVDPRIYRYDVELVTAAAIPEPSSFVLVCLGAIGFTSRRRRTM